MCWVQALNDHKVLLEGTLLKPNMVSAGAQLHPSAQYSFPRHTSFDLGGGHQEVLPFRKAGLMAIYSVIGGSCDMASTRSASGSMRSCIVHEVHWERQVMHVIS